MKKIFHSCILLLPFFLTAQHQDNIWIGGINTYPGSPNYGNFTMRFDNDLPTVSQVDLGMNFESAVAAISDSTGDYLELYSNGCEIRNSLGQLLTNGDSLNPGSIHDLVCPKNGYIAPRGAMLLEQPDHAGIFYLFHIGADFDDARHLLLTKLYYTVINRDANTVISKNNLILEGEFEPFSVVRHGNGRDWWLVIPNLGSNIYTRILLDPTGVSLPEQQAIGDMLFDPNSPVEPLIPNYTASSTFSPNGQHYARFLKYKTMLMDFDRCTGTFSNPIKMEGSPTSIGGGGTAFSPDSKKLYTTTQIAVYETFVEDISPRMDTATAFGIVGGISGKSLHMMQSGPNGKIYISSTNREKDLAVINAPFSDGLDIDVDMLGVELPVYNVRGLPHFPNFRLYDWADSPCDTLGISVSENETIRNEPLISISPNPAKDVLFLSLPSKINGELQFLLFNSAGQIVQSVQLRTSVEVQKLTLQKDLSNGLYFWRIQDYSKRIVGQGKVLIER